MKMQKSFMSILVAIAVLLTALPISHHIVLANSQLSMAVIENEIRQKAQSYSDSKGDAQTAAGLISSLKADANGYTVNYSGNETESFFLLKSVKGAKEAGANGENEILVPGYDGYASASVTITLTGSNEKKTIGLLSEIKHTYEEITWTTVLDGKNPENVVTYSGGNYANQPKNKFVVSTDGKQLMYYTGSAQKVILPDGIESLNASENILACVDGVNTENNKKTKILVLPDTLTTIGDKDLRGAGWNGNALEVLVLGNNITEFKSWTIAENRKLKYLKLPSSLKKLSNNDLTMLAAATDIILPYGLTSINSRTFFDGLDKISELYLPYGTSLDGEFNFGGKFKGKLLIPNSTQPGYTNPDFSAVEYAARAQRAVDMVSMSEIITDIDIMTAVYNYLGKPDVYSIEYEISNSENGTIELVKNGNTGQLVLGVECNNVTPAQNLEEAETAVRANALNYAKKEGNAQTAVGLITALSISANGYTVNYSGSQSDSFFLLKSVKGAKEAGPNGENEILVPGYDGYTSASVTITMEKSNETRTIALLSKIENTYEEIEWATFLDGNDSANIVTYLGGGYNDQPKNKFIVSADGKQLMYYTGSAQKVILPDGIESLNASENILACVDGVNTENNKKTKILVLPDTLTTIGDKDLRGAGWSGNALEVIVLGNNITEFKSWTIAENRKLKYLKLPSSLKKLSNNDLTMLAAATDIILPYGLTSINSRTFFDGLDKISELYLPYGTSLDAEFNFGGKFKGELVIPNSTQPGYTNPDFSAVEYAARAQRAIDMVDISETTTDVDIVNIVYNYLGKPDTYNIGFKIKNSLISENNTGIMELTKDTTVAYFDLCVELNNAIPATNLEEAEAAVRSNAKKYAEKEGNYQTAVGLMTTLSMAANGYTVSYSGSESESFFLLKSVQGAKEFGPNGEDEILVSGYDGYANASVVIKMDESNETKTISLLSKIEHTYEDIEWTTVLDGNDSQNVVIYSGGGYDEQPEDKFIVSSDGKQLVYYTGSAQKVILPDGIESLNASENILACVDGVNTENNKKTKILILPDSLSNIGDKDLRGAGWNGNALEVLVLGKNVSELKSWTIAENRSLKYLFLPSALKKISNNDLTMLAAATDVVLPYNIISINSRTFFDGLDNVSELYIPYGAALEAEFNFGGKFTGKLVIPNSTQPGYTNPDFSVVEYAARAQRAVDMVDITKTTTDIDVMTAVYNYLGKPDIYGIEYEIEDISNGTIKLIKNDNISYFSLGVESESIVPVNTLEEAEAAVRANALKYAEKEKNYQTAAGLVNYLSVVANGYTVDFSGTQENSFYVLKSITGAREKGPNGENEILVPGYDGYTSATVTITMTDNGETKSVALLSAFEHEYEEIEWQTVLDGNDPNNIINVDLTKTSFEDYPKNKFVVNGDNLLFYTGDADKVIIPDGITVWQNMILGSQAGQYNVDNNKKTKILILPDSITEIPCNGVRGNGWESNSLEVLVLGENVSKIHSWSVANNRSLKYVYIPNSVTSISYFSFNMLASTNSLVLPLNLTKLWSTAFSDGLDNVPELFIPYNTVFENEDAQLNFGGKFNGELIIPNAAQNGYTNPDFSAVEYAARAQRVIEMLGNDPDISAQDIIDVIENYLGAVSNYGIALDSESSIDGEVILAKDGLISSFNIGMKYSTPNVADSSKEYMLHLDNIVSGSVSYKWVELTPGKTYVYSVYSKYEESNNQHLHVAYKSDLSGNTVRVNSCMNPQIDSEYYLFTCEFTVPTDGAIVESNGKVLYQIGIDGGNGNAEGYYYGFKLCEKGSSQNIFPDPYFKNGLKDWVDSNGNIGTAGLLKTNSKESELIVCENADFFKREEKLDVLEGKWMIHNNGSYAYPTFYQELELEKDKMYVFQIRARYVIENLCSLRVWYNVADDNVQYTTLSMSTETYKTETSISYNEFTIPNDAVELPNGKVRVRIGFSCGETGASAYFTDLLLYEKDDISKYNLLVNPDFKYGLYGWNYSYLGLFSVDDVNTITKSFGEDVNIELLPFNEKNFLDDTNDEIFDDGDWAAIFMKSNESQSNDVSQNETTDELDNFENETSNKPNDYKNEISNKPDDYKNEISNKPDDYKNEISNETDEEKGKTTQILKNNGRYKKIIRRITTSWWVYVLIIGAVVLVLAIIIIVLIVLKKKGIIFSKKNLKSNKSIS